MEKTVFDYFITIMKMVKDNIKCENHMKISIPQLMVLQVIEYKDGKITNKEIAQKMHITNASMSLMIKKLESTGYLKISKNKTDKRSNFISLSKEGINILKESKNLFVSTGEKLFSKLTKQEYSQLKILFQKVC